MKDVSPRLLLSVSGFSGLGKNMDVSQIVSLLREEIFRICVGRLLTVSKHRVLPFIFLVSFVKLHLFCFVSCRAT
jgi:hypothetical protein